MVKLEQSGVFGQGRRIKRFAGLNLSWRNFRFLTTVFLHQENQRVKLESKYMIGR
jgi:hypothetical protein